MEIVLNYSTSNTTEQSVRQSPISSSSPEQNCLQVSSSDAAESNPDYLNELIKEKFNDATVIISVVVLVLINIVVIGGNILVILSVFTSTKLRTVTNFFIVSLAVADFLVGIAVLPYSLTSEILDTWIFGEIWCQGWLVIDVWMCTASILNLCAISVDRYLAVTQPVRYRSLMTAKRAKYIIAAVWILSFIICFPLLVVRTKELSSRNSANRSQPINPSTYQMPSIWLDSGPILDSDTLHAPPGTILHRASDRSTNQNLSSSLTSNIVSTSSSDLPWLPRPSGHPALDPSNSSLPGNTSKPCIPQPVQCALFLNKSYVIYSAFGSFYIPMFVMIFFYWRIYLVAIRTTRALKRGYRTTKSSGDGTSEERLTLRIHRGYATEDNLGDKCVASHEVPTKSGKKSRTESDIKSRIPITIYKTARSNKSTLTVGNMSVGPTVKCGVKTNTLSPGDIAELNGKNRRKNSPGCQSTLSLPSSSSPSSSREGSAKSNKVVMARLSKRTSKYQAKRFHAETKAAKTVGIIVGGFIVCWLPFFTVYLTRAFCEDCISELLFSIFFWLGYCNSMINPCIYGLFSRDFRRAFKNIICRCKFSEETSVSSLIRQIHMPTFFEDMPEEMAKHESQEY